MRCFYKLEYQYYSTTIGCRIRILETQSSIKKILWPFLYEFRFVLVSKESNSSSCILTRVVDRENCMNILGAFKALLTIR